MSRWEDDSIQFPRLIAEMEAAGVFSEIKEETWDLLLESTDLSIDDIFEVVERAQSQWDKIVSQTP